MRKKRILFVSEASFMHSGFGKFYRELLTRIYANDKYEIAEFASYGIIEDPRAAGIKWRYYANHVDKKDSRYEELKRSRINEFGAWRFERVLIDFKPDIVFDMRDSFMFSFEATSPLREFYHWCIVPTVDSAPQKLEWINMFRSADSLFVYSDWATPILEKQGGGKINLVGELSPGVDLNVFKPVQDKIKHKATLGITGDSIIIGTVMRNQVRKLYPDLFSSFRKLLDTAPKHIADNLYLYCHTSYPDNAWNIPDLILDYEVAPRVLFTYVCSHCKNWEASLFKGAKSACTKCSRDTLFLPNTSNGLSDLELAKVYNLFDLYVQYANCEGFGMPAVEAAACGVPVAEVDYSAMSDVVRKLGGMPIPVKAMKREIHEYAYRAIPDNDACASIMNKFICLPEMLRLQRGYKTRLLADKHYNWDDKVAILEKHFDSIELEGSQGQWDSKPADIFQPTQTPPTTNLSNVEFVLWCYKNMLNQELSDSNAYQFANFVSLLNQGFTENGAGTVIVDKAYIANQIHRLRTNKNHVEQARTGVITMSTEDYIERANRNRSPL